jgi:hypothetical protein
MAGSTVFFSESLKINSTGMKQSIGFTKYSGQGIPMLVPRVYSIFSYAFFIDSSSIF